MAVLDTTILGEIQDLLVEPNDGGATWPSGLWTSAEVIDYLNQRQQSFLMETQATVKRASQGIAPTLPRQTLPQDWIATRRIAFQPEGFDLFNGLVSFWRLGEPTGFTRVDSIGPNNLTDTNAVAAGAGKIQGAASFTRALSQKLSILDAAQVGLNPNLGDFSISAWVYPFTLTGGNLYTIVSKGATGNAPQAEGYWLFLGGATTGIGLGVRFGDSVQLVRGCQFNVGSIFSLNTWTHIVVTFDRDGSAIAYLNGAVATTSPMNLFGSSSAACNPANPFSLGYPDPSATDYFDGRIDATGYWSRVLSSEEVAVLYHEAIGRELYPAVNGLVPTGQNFQALSPGDQFEMDQFTPRWATSPATRPSLYSDADPQTLEVVMLPPSLGNGTLHLLYVAQPTTLTGAGTAFSIPDEFVPTIKWGVVEDMLGKVGRAHDPIRAKVASELWDFGVEAAKALMEGFA